MAKTSTLEVPLVLGGHSFIGQLGNDPAPDAMAQRDIVEACVRAGICWFDTTSLFGEGIDRLIVSMRRVAWVAANVESVERGPLTSTELTLLRQLMAHEPG